MAQLVEQEKHVQPAGRALRRRVPPLARAGAGAAALGGAGPRKRDGAVRAPRVSDHEARAVALHERRADRRAHVRARDRRHRGGRTAADAGRSSAPIAHAVCVNGRFAPQLVASRQRCRRACSFSVSKRRIASHPALIEPYLAKLSLTQTNAFTSLNTAFLRDGIVADRFPRASSSSSRLK